MATVTRPQSLGKVTATPSTTVAGVVVATQGQGFRSMYLQRKKEEYAQVLQATMTEAQTNLELEMFRRKQLMQLLGDLQQQGAGLKSMNAQLAQGGDASLAKWKYSAGMQAEQATRSTFGFQTSEMEQITKMTTTSDTTRDEVLGMSDIAAKAMADQATSDEVIQALRQDAHTGQLSQSLRRIADEEATRGMGGTTLQLAAHDVSRELIQAIENDVNFQLSSAQKDEIRELVGSKFNLSVPEVKDGSANAAAIRDKRMAEIPGSTAMKRYNEALAELEAGDSEAVAKLKASLAAENQAQIDKLAEEERKLREQIAAPLEAPTYEDILAKAATRYKQPASPREQMRLAARKRLAHRAAKQLEEGTPEQKVLLQTASRAVRMLDESEGILPKDTTPVGAYAEDMFRQFSSKHLSMDDAVQTAMEMGLAQSGGDVEKAKETRDAILTRFFALKRQSGQSKAPTQAAAQQERLSQEQLMMERLTPATTPDPYKLSQSENYDLISSAIGSMQAGDDYALSLTLQKIAQRIPDASENEAATLRAVAAQGLYLQGLRQQDAGEMTAGSANLQKAMEQLGDVPQDYQWDVDATHPDMIKIHEGLTSTKP